MLIFDKFIPVYFGATFTRFADESKVDALIAIYPELEKFFKENMGNGKFLTGTDSPGYIDVHCYVFMERLVLLEKFPNEGVKKLKTQEGIPTVCTYVNNFRAHPLM